MAKKYVEYNGPSDTRKLTKADFGKLGVEADGMSFHQGEVYEVDDALLDVLTGEETVLVGEFSEVSSADVEIVDDDEAPKSRKKASNPPATAEAASAGGTTTRAGRTGRGSTAGSAT